MTTACMGGWCTKRDHCPHHHAANRQQPSERLCIPGADGYMVRDGQVVALYDAPELPSRLPSSFAPEGALPIPEA